MSVSISKNEYTRVHSYVEYLIDESLLLDHCKKLLTKEEMFPTGKDIIRAFMVEMNKTTNGSMKQTIIKRLLAQVISILGYANERIEEELSPKKQRQLVHILKEKKDENEMFELIYHRWTLRFLSDYFESGVLNYKAKGLTHLDQLIPTHNDVNNAITYLDAYITANKNNQEILHLIADISIDFLRYYLSNNQFEKLQEFALILTELKDKVPEKSNTIEANLKTIHLFSSLQLDSPVLKSKETMLDEFLKAKQFIDIIHMLREDLVENKLTWMFRCSLPQVQELTLEVRSQINILNVLWKVLHTPSLITMIDLKHIDLCDEELILTGVSWLNEAWTTLGSPPNQKERIDILINCLSEYCNMNMYEYISNLGLSTPKLERLNVISQNLNNVDNKVTSMDLVDDNSVESDALLKKLETQDSIDINANEVEDILCHLLNKCEYSRLIECATNLESKLRSSLYQNDPSNRANIIMLLKVFLNISEILQILTNFTKDPKFTQGLEKIPLLLDTFYNLTIKSLSIAKCAEWAHDVGMLSKITNLEVVEMIACLFSCSLQHLHYTTSVRFDWRPDRLISLISKYNQSFEWLVPCKALVLSNEISLVTIYRETLKRLLSISQDHYSAALGLGDCYYFLRAYKDALKYYIIAGNLESEFFTDYGIPSGIVQSMSKMIDCFIGMKKFDQATVMRQFISTKETYVEMYNTVQQFGLYFQPECFEFIYDITLLELLIYMHAKAEEKVKLNLLMNQIRKPELNENNDIEQRKKVILNIKRQFFSSITAEYLII